MRLLLIPIAMLCLLAVPSAHAAGARDCGLTSRIDGVRYQVKETKGTLACSTAKRIVTPFLRDGTIKKGWACFRGHASQNQDWAASCARGKVLIRVYAPN
jgi:hypothetical protein